MKRWNICFYREKPKIQISFLKIIVTVASKKYEAPIRASYAKKETGNWYDLLPAGQSIRIGIKVAGDGAT